MWIGTRFPFVSFSNRWIPFKAVQWIPLKRGIERGEGRERARPDPAIRTKLRIFAVLSRSLAKHNRYHKVPVFEISRWKSRSPGRVPHGLATSPRPDPSAISPYPQRNRQRTARVLCELGSTFGRGGGSFQVDPAAPLIFHPSRRSTRARAP